MSAWGHSLYDKPYHKVPLYITAGLYIIWLALNFLCRGLVTKTRIMEPKVININGKQYRLFEMKISDNNGGAATTPVQVSDQTDERDNCPIDVKITAKGPSYTHSFYVAKPFFGYIIGKKGATLQKLQNDTKTWVKIPKDHGDVVITSGNPTAIVSARHEIASIIEQSRNKIKTHFLAIPLRDDNIASNFEKFKSDILTDTGKNSKGVTEKLFQKPEKMHFTLGGMLALVDDNEIKMAIEALQECHEAIIKPTAEKHGAIKIKVQGLEGFCTDSTKARVLFGRVTSENDVLQELAEKIVEFFETRGLMRKEHATVTLHMTVMNTSFMIDKTLRRFNKPPETFDATDILKVHKDYIFGESTLKTIHMCQLGPTAEDGYYQITSRVNLDD